MFDLLKKNSKARAKGAGDPLNSIEFIKAAKSGNAVSIQAAVSRGLNVHSIDPETGESALHFSVLRNDLSRCQQFLKMGLKPDVQDHKGNTPLMVAVEKNFQKIIKELVAAQPSAFGLFNEGLETSINIALRIGQQKVAMFLIDRGESVETAMQSAVARGDWDQIEWLCQHKGNPNLTDDEGYSPLVQAIEDKSLEHVMRWVDLGADINFTGGNGKHTNRVGWTPLMVAIDLGRNEIARYLLSQPTVDLDATAPDHNSALSLIVARGHFDLYSIVMRREVDFAKKTPDGTTMLMFACQSGKLAMVDEIYQQTRSQLNDQEANGWSALLFASAGGHLECVEFLLAQGANRHLKLVDSKLSAESIVRAQKSTLDSKDKDSRKRYDVILKRLAG